MREQPNPAPDAESLRLLHQTLVGEALSTALDLARCAVAVSGDDGSILAVNEAWLKLLGYTRADLPDLTAHAISADPEPAHVDSVYAHVWRGVDVMDTAWLRRKDGTVGRIRYRAMAATISALSVVVTITEDISSFQPIEGSAP